MRRTDEAFKNELFRRYGQYKKNRRNLRMLAAAPCVASVGLVSLLLLPQFVPLGQGNSPTTTDVNDAAHAQPSDTTVSSIAADEEPDSDCAGDETIPSITEEEMQALVDACGTFQDLVALIGEPHTTVTSGLFTPAWNLADGRMLIVWVGSDPDLSIEKYEFWESPMTDIVESLERCDIGNITVTDGFDDNAAFYRSYTNQTNVETIRELIYACTRLSVMGGPTEVDPSTVDTLQGTSRIFQINGTPDPDYYGGNTVESDLYYEIELLDTSDGLFFGYRDCNVSEVADRWFKISYDPFNALWDYIETHDEDSVIGIVPENPFNDLLSLLDNIEIKTVTVTGPDGTALYTGNEIVPILDRLKNAMSVVYKESIIDNMDGITYTIQIAPSLENEVLNYRTFELFAGKYLRAPDHGIEQWYEIDEKLAQALIDSFSTGKPLDEWTLDSYALTSLSATVVQTGEELAVTDGESLDKIADLLLQINESALLPDYQTLEWLNKISADPSSVADNAAPFYAVTLHTNKAYSFYLFGDFLFADGSWWAIDYASMLEYLISGKTYTPPADNPIKSLLGETQIDSIFIMPTQADALANVGYQLNEGTHQGYIEPLTDQLSYLTLSECAPQNISICDWMIVIEHSGIIDRAIDRVDYTIGITLFEKRYLFIDVTSDESYWYELPESEADELSVLLEKIEADLE